MSSKKPTALKPKPGNENGRKPILPSLLAAHNPQMRADMAEAGRGLTEAEILEEYNAIKELFEPGQNGRSLDARTDLSSLQILHMSRARTMASYFEIGALDTFVNDIERLSISKDRKSRKEFVSSLQSVSMSEGEHYASGLRGVLEKLRS